MDSFSFAAIISNYLAYERVIKLRKIIVRRIFGVQATIFNIHVCDTLKNCKKYYKKILFKDFSISYSSNPIKLQLLHFCIK